MNSVENHQKYFHKRARKGFSLFETLIYLSISFVIMAIVVAFVFWFIDFSNKNRIIAEVSSSSKRSLDIISYEIRGAESIYWPTSSESQLSLETKKYLPAGENSSYIDFYLCGNRLCLKKESQDPIVLTPDSVEIVDLNFTYILPASIKIDLTLNYKNIAGRADYDFSTILTSSASLRDY